MTTDRNQALRDALDDAHNAPREGDGRSGCNTYARAADRALKARALAMREPASEPNDNLRELYRRGQRIERDGVPAPASAPSCSHPDCGCLVNFLGGFQPRFPDDCPRLAEQEPASEPLTPNQELAEINARRYREACDSLARDWKESHRVTPASEPACQHEWVDATNSYVSNASMCVKCKTLAPTDNLPASEPAPASAHEPEIVGLRYNSDRQKYEPSEPAPASAPSCCRADEPVGWMLKTGHGLIFREIKPEGLAVDMWSPLYARARAQPCQCGEMADESNMTELSQKIDRLQAKLSALAATAPRSGESHE